MKLESSFVLNEAKILQNSFSEYASIVTSLVSPGYPTEEEDRKVLLSLKMKIESNLGIIFSVYGGDRNMGDCGMGLFIEAIESLNDMLISVGTSNPDYAEAKDQFKMVKKRYGCLLAGVKAVAIEALSRQDH